jgi:uncharacterized protein YegL
MVRFGILGVVVLIAALALTNPNLEAHKSVVYASVAQQAIKNKLLGKIAADVLDSVDAFPLKYNNYFLFSTTTLHNESASFGLFSHVWKRDLHKATTDE